jgi:hypothetical protein
MFVKHITFCIAIALALLVSTAAADTKKKSDKKKEVWTDTADPTLPVDYKYQGEYVGKDVGCQVIALGNGTFQAVVCKGGLPGAGWDGKNKSLMDGKLEGDKVVFEPAAGKRQYLAKDPLKFSATAKFPPMGQGEYSAVIVGEALTLKEPAMTVELKRTVRKSPTMGAKAPDGAVVLFDGTSKDAWDGGRVDKTTGFLNTDGNDITTRKKFSNYTAHVEFMVPFRPDARDQGRGNSGFYQVDMYEVQILDSFGLEGKDNECGGIYQRANCKVNMCLPPLQWQTYDVDFTNAVRDGAKVDKKARITVRHNGVVIHDDIEIKSPTGGARNEPEGTPGVLRLQGHGNPVQFRNIWVVEK